MIFLTFEIQRNFPLEEIFKISYSQAYFLLFVLLAFITWFAAATRRMKLYKVIKPLVTIPLIAWFIMMGRTDPPFLYFLIGLCFSLLGDIALVFWKTTTFFVGMFLFAIAHVFYSIGYSQWPTPWFSFGSLLLVPAFVILFATLVYRPASSKDPRMKTYFQVGLVYGVFMFSMLTMAGTSFWREGWTLLPAVMTLTGALLFVVSDILIAVEALGYTEKNVRFWVISLYHLSQFLITSSVLYVANGGFYL